VQADAGPIDLRYLVVPDGQRVHVVDDVATSRNA
jgi:orotate phosphoribosyltransferase